MWVLSVELASYYIFGTKNFEVAAFWKMCAPLIKRNVVPSWNDCRHINAALHSHCIVNLDIAVNAKLLSIAVEVSSGFSFLLPLSYKICCTAVSIINIYRSSCKVFLSDFNQFISNFRKVCPVRAALIRAGRRNDEACNMPKCDSLLAVFNGVTVTVNTLCEK
jgi:hypothetical protein